MEGLNLERLTKNFMISISQIAYVEQSDVISKVCRKYLDFYRYATENEESTTLYKEIKAFNDLTQSLNNPYSNIDIPKIDLIDEYKVINIQKFKVINFLNRIVDLNSSSTQPITKIDISILPTNSGLTATLEINNTEVSYTEQI